MLPRNFVFSLIFLILGSVTINEAEAIALYDCNASEFGGPQSTTWYWHQMCWLEIEFHEDIPDIELVKVRTLTTADIWEGYPDWSAGPFYDWDESTTEGAIYRTGSSPDIFMSTNGEVRAYTWAIKYESMVSFNQPVLYAPLEVYGTYFYRVNGVWNIYLPMSNNDHTNRCAASCGYGTYWFDEPWHP